MEILNRRIQIFFRGSAEVPSVREDAMIGHNWDGHIAHSVIMLMKTLLELAWLL